MVLTRSAAAAAQATAQAAATVTDEGSDVEDDVESTVTTGEAASTDEAALAEPKETPLPRNPAACLEAMPVETKLIIVNLLKGEEQYDTADNLSHASQALSALEFVNRWWKALLPAMPYLETFRLELEPDSSVNEEQQSCLLRLVEARWSSPLEYLSFPMHIIPLCTLSRFLHQFSASLRSLNDDCQDTTSSETDEPTVFLLPRLTEFNLGDQTHHLRRFDMCPIEEMESGYHAGSDWPALNTSLMPIA